MRGCIPEPLRTERLEYKSKEFLFEMILPEPVIKNFLIPIPLEISLFFANWVEFFAFKHFK